MADPAPVNHSWFFQWLVGGVDMPAAILVFGRTDITVSALCWVARYGKVADLKLWGWQRTLLLWLEGRLGREHCAQARISDEARAHATLNLLGDP